MTCDELTERRGVGKFIAPQLPQCTNASPLSPQRSRLNPPEPGRRPKKSPVEKRGIIAGLGRGVAGCLYRHGALTPSRCPHALTVPPKD